MEFWVLRMGTTGLIAQSLGKGDYREIVNIIIRNLSIAILVGLTIILLKDWIILIIFKYFSVSQETLLLIEKYISIRILSAPARISTLCDNGLYLGFTKNLYI